MRRTYNILPSPTKVGKLPNVCFGNASVLGHWPLPCAFGGRQVRCPKYFCFRGYSTLLILVPTFTCCAHARDSILSVIWWVRRDSILELVSRLVINFPGSQKLTRSFLSSNLFALSNHCTLEQPVYVMSSHVIALCNQSFGKLL